MISIDEVAIRLGKSAEQISDAFFAERQDQASRCRVTEPIPDALDAALVRRVQRNLAMRNVPLGVLQDETGGIRLGWQDPEVRRLEGPYRKTPVA